MTPPGSILTDLTIYSRVRVYKRTCGVSWFAILIIAGRQMIVMILDVSSMVKIMVWHGIVDDLRGGLVPTP